MSWLFQEPSRDPKLAAALRQLDDGSPRDSEPLRQRILAAARPRLGELRSPTPRWWEWISPWLPVALPMGLAASLAAGLLVPAGTEISSDSSSAVEVGTDSTLVIAAFSEGSVRSQWAAHLVAPESGDWLFEQAITQ
jgi:anti-sigma factor RsiW